MIYTFCEFALNPLSSIANFIWIQYLFQKFTINRISVSQIHYFSRFQWKFIIFFANSLSFSRIFYKLTIYFAISFWIHYLFRKITVCFANSPWIHFFPRNHYEYTILSWNKYKFTICFAISMLIHYLIIEITVNTLFFNMNSLFASLFHHKFTFCFANLP